MSNGVTSHDASRVTVRPVQGWELPDVADLLRHRHVLFVLVWRNVMHRYRQTLLGPLWFVISPLVRIVIYSVVLGRVAGLSSEGIPYPLFAYAALLPWELFASGVARGTGCFVRYQHIISKVYFPRLLVPMAEVITALVDFTLSFVILLGMMFAYGYFPSLRMLALVPLLLLAMILALNLGLLFAALQARFRDVENFIRYAVQFWFYATPVAYSATVLEGKIPEGLHAIYALNPMNGVIEGCRWALLGAGRPPDLALLITAGAAIVLLVVTAAIFLRTEHSIVDLV